MSQHQQPIVGVNTALESEIRSRYPSISKGGLGQFIGRVCDSIPVRIWGMRLSRLIFGLPMAPLAAVLYLYEKLMGEKYVLTNRSLSRCKSLGIRQLQSIDLTEIGEIELSQRDGQAFYNAADMHVIDSKGKQVMVLQAVPHADIFRESILKARDARVQTEEALATINARQTA